MTVSMAIQITITVFTRLYRLKKSKRFLCESNLCDDYCFSTNDGFCATWSLTQYQSKFKTDSPSSHRALALSQVLVTIVILFRL